MKDVRKVKQLTTQMSQLWADVEALEMEIQIRDRERQQKVNEIKRLKRDIDRINNKKVLRVSEHALIRYFERVEGYNLAEIEKKILSEDVIKLVDKLGDNGTYPSHDFSVVMKDSVVVTINK